MPDYSFKSIGENVRIFPGAKIVGAEYLEIGSNVIIDDFVFIQVTEPSYIGNYVHIASFTSITGGGEFKINDFCGLASGTRVITGSDDFLGSGLTNPTVPQEFRSVTRSHVTLHKHSIIGANAVIFPGVTIGEGCAVGAGSIVTKNLDAWSVYAGTPARRVKERPSRDIRKKEEQLFNKMGHPKKLFS